MNVCIETYSKIPGDALQEELHKLVARVVPQLRFPCLIDRQGVGVEF